MLNILDLKQKQEQLDTFIIQKHNLKKDDALIRKIRLALITEIGEMVNERPDIFKYWKKSATVDKDKFKEEYSDILHFALSIDNYTNQLLNEFNSCTNCDDKAKVSNFLDKKINEKYECMEITIDDSTDIQYYVIQCIEKICNCDEVLYNTLLLGRLLGITYEDIENEYNRKYKINIERQNNNY